jgi:ribulose kinase
MTVDPKRALVVGVDFGTLSGRALVVRVADGAELGSGVYECKHGVVDDRFRLPAFCCRLIGAQNTWVRGEQGDAPYSRSSPANT